MGFFLRAFTLKPAALIFLCLAVLPVFIKGCSGLPGDDGTASDAADQVTGSIEGKWGIDKNASAEYARQSPRWRDEDEASIHAVLDMLSAGYFITVGPDSILVEAMSGRIEVPVELVQSSAGTYIFKGVVNDVEVEFTAVMDEHGRMNFRSSVSDDFDYLLWKRID